MFNITGPHYCPTCPPVMVGKHKDRKSSETQLELQVENYSGCGVDIATCPSCKKTFQISYKADEIKEVSGR
jgi:uncharacterized Zn finger protein (UPF0148 family)